MDRPMQTMA